MIVVAVLRDSLSALVFELERVGDFALMVECDRLVLITVVCCCMVVCALFGLLFVFVRVLGFRGG